MIRSMTGFARVERSGEWGTLTLELRSVNHRYLEQIWHVPEGLSALEVELRGLLSRQVKRGRVELWLRHQGSAAAKLRLNTGLVEELGKFHAVLQSAWGQAAAPVQLMEVLRWPGVLQSDTVDADALSQSVLALTSAALDALQDSRQREGRALADIISEKLGALEKEVAQVRAILPELEQATRQRLQQRLGDLAQNVEPGRWEQELVFYLQRQDVVEELDRLDAHLGELRQVLKRSEAVGRRLDFLVQECNREANTLGSKAADHRLSMAAVEMKVLIEQMREQIQNVE